MRNRVLLAFIGFILIQYFFFVFMLWMVNQDGGWY